VDEGRAAGKVPLRREAARRLGASAGPASPPAHGNPTAFRGRIHAVSGINRTEVTMAEKTESKVPASYASPFSTFRNEMDRLVESFFGQPRWGGDLEPFAGFGERARMFMPSVDVKEDEKTVVLTAELPGMDEKDVQLECKNGMLVLSGEKKHEYEEKKDTLHVVERRYGSVQRAWRLPDTVDPTRIEAKFEKGVLTVTMPKREDVPPASQKIQISH
jgi:HSP20 family protein